MITVVVADDHPMIRAGLRSVIAGMPDAELVAEVDTGETAVAAVVEHQPTVVVIDLHMPPGIDGLEAIRRIHRLAVDTRVVVLTMNEEDVSLLAAMQAGACGYLVKGAGYDEIQGAITAAAAGDAVFGAAVADRMLDILSTTPQTDAVEDLGLSQREREVLGLLAAGSGTNDIARRLHISPKTVRNYVSALLTKLDVPDRAQAIAWARTAGLGPPEGR